MAGEMRADMLARKIKETGMINLSFINYDGAGR